ALPGRREGAAGAPVLLAREFRAVDPPVPGDHPGAARLDLHVRRHVGAYLVAFRELTKPRITRRVVLTAGAGFYLGSERGVGVGVDLGLLLRTLLGTALVAAGTNAFNQWRERDVDARMHRTRGRPLPSGRITPRAAAAFAGIISVAGVAYLAFAVNLLTAEIGRAH